jgi:hypothetical protein
MENLILNIMYVFDGADLNIFEGPSVCKSPRPTPMTVHQYLACATGARECSLARRIYVRFCGRVHVLCDFPWTFLPKTPVNPFVVSPSYRTWSGNWWAREPFLSDPRYIFRLRHNILKCFVYTLIGIIIFTWY